LQAGFLKSKAKNLKGIVKDNGFDVNFSMFFGMDYGWRSDPSVPYSAFTEYISLTKYYLGYNQYVTLDLKVVDLKIDGGAFLNLNHAVGMTGSASFLTAGWHFGESLIKPFNSSKKGYAANYIGIGFDQYFAFKGGYIGSFGLKFGF
jgi:hypothetical protein